MTSFSFRTFRVWQRNRDVFLHLWKNELPSFLVEPLIIIGAMGVGLGTFVGLVDGQRYLEFVAPGILAAYAMFGAVFECTYGSFIRMQVQRTFDAIIATPLNIEDVIVGEIVWGATRSLITAAAILLVVAAFGLVPSPWALLILPVALLEGLMFSSLAMAYTSIAPSIYSFNYFFTLFVTPMFFFSGVFFPVSAMPAIAQKLAWFAPLTPVATLVRALMRGTLGPGLLLELAYVVVLAAGFFGLAVYGMRRRLIK